MAQLERSRSRYSDTPRTPKQQNAPTFDQLLKVDESCSPTTPKSGTNQCNQEHCLSPNNSKKSSVFSKVREGAKKLKSSLSGRKSVHYGNEFLYEYSNNNSPPHADHTHHTLDDNDDHDDRADDPEYFGAPMYESEAAPENLRETARQHPRATPVVAENHRTPNKTNHMQENDRSEKFTSKFSGLAIALPESQESANATIDESTRKSTVMSSSNPGYEAKEIREKSGDPNQYRACSRPQIWDKGVSVKEYFMSKLEPGDDERALSHAITEAISPRGSTNNSGMVEKVKEAVTSFFRQDDVLRSMTMPARSYSASASSSDFSATTRPTRSHSTKHPYVPTDDFSPQFTRSANANPIANANANANVHANNANANEVLEEENHGKILQTN